jgi:hypothetical protein
MVPVHVTFQAIIKNCIILCGDMLNAGISTRVGGTGSAIIRHTIKEYEGEYG